MVAEFALALYIRHMYNHMNILQHTSVLLMLQVTSAVGVSDKAMQQPPTQ